MKGLFCIYVCTCIYGIGAELLHEPPMLHQHGRNSPLSVLEQSSYCNSRPKLHTACSPDHWVKNCSQQQLSAVLLALDPTHTDAFCFLACRLTFGSASLFSQGCGSGESKLMFVFFIFSNNTRWDAGSGSSFPSSREISVDLAIANLGEFQLWQTQLHMPSHSYSLQLQLT